MNIEEVYEWGFDDVARKSFRQTTCVTRCWAEMHGWGKLHISGPLRVLRLPQHFDFADLRLTPTQVRARLEASDERTWSPFKLEIHCIARMKN